jgi:multicomponent Na+:H+ antiporter subunit E
MARLIVVSLRLLIWLLLSADLEAANVAIGLAVALALPLPRQQRHLQPSALARSLLASLRAIPLAYQEAFVLLWRRPAREVEQLQAAEFRRRRPVSALVFLDVFRITITPLTIALGMDASGGSYRVHRLEEER